MPSRMEKYYQSDTAIKKRSSKNEDLYRTIYEEGEYTNVEGISIIEKNEKIDIEKIRELIGHREIPKKEVPIERPRAEPIYEEREEEKNYDIRDILDKAKSERPEKDKFSNTQYNILKGINIEDTLAPPKMNDVDLKDMIEAITNNSKLAATGDLLDDLKTIHDAHLQDMVEEEMHEKNNDNLEIDRSFYTSSLGFTSDDFEDLKEMKKSLKTNNILTKILLFILLVVIVTSAIFLIYHFIVK